MTAPGTATPDNPAAVAASGARVADADRRSARRRLRDAGLRATRPRVQVLEWLDAHPGHHAADAIVAGSGVPKATVYHVLGQLRAEGLVVIADAGPGRTLYETAAEAHHHFVCRACDRIIDVPADLVARPAAGAVTGARVDEADVILRGRCDACADGP